MTTVDALAETGIIPDKCSLIKIEVEGRSFANDVRLYAKELDYQVFYKSKESWDFASAENNKFVGFAFGPEGKLPQLSRCYK
jgi:hypothetical protein